MRKLSRRQNENLKKIKNVVHSSLEEAINLLQETATAKFIESVELHANLNIDPKYANQQLRTSLVLPNGTGKSLRIAVFTEPDYVAETLALGADVAGSDDLIEEINTGKLNFDLLITTPQLMPKLAKLGRVLGPKGLMPSPKSGTVTTNLKEAINEFKKGKLEIGFIKNFQLSIIRKIDTLNFLVGEKLSNEKLLLTKQNAIFEQSKKICFAMWSIIQIDCKAIHDKWFLEFFHFSKILLQKYFFNIN